MYSIHRVSEVLVHDFLLQNKPVSMEALTEVMKACRRMGQVSIAVDLFYAYVRHTRKLPGEEVTPWGSEGDWCVCACVSVCLYVCVHASATSPVFGSH